MRQDLFKKALHLFFNSSRRIKEIKGSLDGCASLKNKKQNSPTIFPENLFTLYQKT